MAEDQLLDGVGSDPATQQGPECKTLALCVSPHARRGPGPPPNPTQTYSSEHGSWQPALPPVMKEFPLASLN